MGETTTETVETVSKTVSGFACTVLASELKQALAKLATVMSGNKSIPILGNVLLRTSSANGTVSVTGTDLDTGIILRVQAHDTVADGAVTVSYKALKGVVAGAAKGAMVKLSVSTNGMLVCESASGKIMLGTLGADSFPVMPTAPVAVEYVPAGTLCGMIERTIFAVHKEESRYMLNGALLMLKDQSVEMVATDGHRLSHVQALGGDHATATQVLVPLDALKVLLRVFGKETAGVAVSSDDNHTFFVTCDATVLPRKLTGQFPAWEKVVPKVEDVKVTLTVKRVELLAVVKNALGCADERTKCIKLDVTDGQCIVTVGDTFSSSVIGVGSGKVKIGFNAVYLIEWLNSLGVESVTLGFSEADRPMLAVVEDHGLTCTQVIMPKR